LWALVEAVRLCPIWVIEWHCNHRHLCGRLYVAASCFCDRNGHAFPSTGVAGLTISFHAWDRSRPCACRPTQRCALFGAMSRTMWSIRHVRLLAAQTRSLSSVELTSARLWGLCSVYFGLTMSGGALLSKIQTQCPNLSIGSLQRSDLIHYRRGHIRLLSLEGFRESACEYATIKAHAGRLLGVTSSDLAW